MGPHTFIDTCNRSITYLRLSITDRCNLSCRYCMPLGGAKKVHQSEILRYEELLRLIRILVPQGIKKVRITGGEPLTRRGVANFAKLLSGVEGLGEICLTTNGVLLNEQLDEIYAAGIRHINVSLDTLKAKRYHEITGGPFWDKVWASLQRALSFGDLVLKINAVIMRGVNHDEIESFAKLSYEYPIQIRFIEFMPIGCGSRWSNDLYMAGTEITERLKVLGPLTPVDKRQNAGPATIYKLPGAIGEIGFINAVSNSFCRSCNRIRITPDGQLRMCLFSDYEIDIKKYLRSGMEDSEIAELISREVRNKPYEHARGEKLLKQCHRQMSQIGG